MKGNSTRFAGLAGIIIFLFGVVGAFLLEFRYSSLMYIPMAHLVIGAALLLTWFFGYGLSHREQAGQIVKGRTARFGANAAIYTILFVAIVVAANWLASRHDKRWDLTEAGVYSIAGQSKQIIEGLKAPLKVVAFKTANGPDPERMTDLLNLYKSVNPGKFSYEIIDPSAKPHLVEKYGMKTGNFVYLEYGDKDPRAVSRMNELTEEALTNGILKLTKAEEKKVYYVTGHGEPDLKSNKPGGIEQFASAIGNEHMKMEPLMLAQIEKIPGDAATVILNAPRKTIPDREKSMLMAYGDDGGRLFLTSDPQVATPEVKEIASHFGIVIGQNVVVDVVRRLFAGPALGVQPIVSLAGEHPILQRFNEGDAGIFNLTSSVTIDDGNAEAKKNCKEFLKTSENSWAETNLQALFDPENPTAAKDADDIAGPVSIAAVCEKKLSSAPEGEEKKEGSEKVSRVIVFGDSDWFANGNLNYGNLDLALNTVNWLAGEEGGVSIRPKEMRKSGNPIAQNDLLMILIGGYLIPEAILLVGLFVWWRRRSLA